MRAYFIVVAAVAIASFSLFWVIKDRDPGKASELRSVEMVASGGASSPERDDPVENRVPSQNINPARAASTASSVNPTSSMILRGENWGRYPGSLGDQVRAALEHKDGAMAHHVANRLSDCIWYVLLPQEMGKANLGNGAGLGAEDQVIRSLCQSVPGEIRPQLLELYALAIEKKSIGAAADLLRVSGSLSGSAGRQLFEDAKAGHYLSVVSAASVLPTAVGLSDSEQAIARQALRQAAQLADPKVGARWLDAERSISASWGNKSGSGSQPARLAPADEEIAQAMAAKLLEKSGRKP